MSSSHLWYLKGIPSYLCVLLRVYEPNLTVDNLEGIIYMRECEPPITKENGLYRFLKINENKNELNLFTKENSTIQFKTEKTDLNIYKNKKRLGSEIIKAALENINLKKEIKKARNLIDELSLVNITKNYIPDKNKVRQIRILESFLATKTNPSWMILTTLPVLPPNLRPLLELENGRLIAADVNEIYRLIITRNQRLFDFMYNFVAPDLITIHSRRLLQESIDSLIDNAKLKKEKNFV